MMNPNSSVVSKERCPECARQGKDTSHDNLVGYSDGHKYCYGCGYYEAGDRVGSFKHSLETKNESDRTDTRLPRDVESYSHAPKRAREWLESFRLNPNQVISANLMWSESRQRLIFPYFINGNLIAWQGRWFGDGSAPKWYTDGKIDQHLYILGPNQGTIVLTEDIVSAIRCSRFCAASPIFGSVISGQRFKMLRQSCDKVVIWLDPDKKKEAVIFARMAGVFGLECDVILSEKDPKEYSDEEIQEYLK